VGLRGCGFRGLPACGLAGLRVGSPARRRTGKPVGLLAGKHRNAETGVQLFLADAKARADKKVCQVRKVAGGLFQWRQTQKVSGRDAKELAPLKPAKRVQSRGRRSEKPSDGVYLVGELAFAPGPLQPGAVEKKIQILGVSHENIAQEPAACEYHRERVNGGSICGEVIEQRRAAGCGAGHSLEAIESGERIGRAAGCPDEGAHHLSESQPFVRLAGHQLKQLICPGAVAEAGALKELRRLFLAQVSFQKQVAVAHRAMQSRLDLPLSCFCESRPETLTEAPPPEAC
jgi:hypothetical protein